MVSGSLNFAGGAGSIVECVFAHAASNPGKLCLADRARSLSYGDVRGLVSACARVIAGRGAGPGDNVVVECDQGVAFVVAVLAAQLAGCRSVPVEKGATMARRVEVAREVGAALYIGGELPGGLAGEPPGEPGGGLPGGLAGTAFLELSSALEGAGGAWDGGAWDGGFPAADSDAEVLFSTGTTGKPKGVVMAHRANLALADNIVRGVRMGADNVEVVPMPLSHSHGLRTVYANLANGSSVVIADGVVALKQMLNLMDEHRATALDLSPSMLSIIFKLSGDRLGEYAGALDYVQLGSAPLPERDKERLAALLPGTRLYNFYGSTEAGRSCVLEFGAAGGAGAAGGGAAGGAGAAGGCIGRPAAHARFAVVDERRRPIESSRERLGFLASSGDGVMRGYFGAPDLTRAVMEDGFVYSNDLGFIGEDGLVYLVGRADDVINFGGVKVAPEEIESVAAGGPLVRDCACAAMPDEVVGQVPVLFVVAGGGAAGFDVEALRRYLARELDASKQPSRIVVVDEIPRTFNGKVRRRELVELLTGAEPRGRG